TTPASRGDVSRRDAWRALATTFERIDGGLRGGSYRGGLRWCWSFFSDGLRGGGAWARGRLRGARPRRARRARFRGRGRLGAGHGRGGNGRDGGRNDQGGGGGGRGRGAVAHGSGAGRNARIG